MLIAAACVVIRTPPRYHGTTLGEELAVPSLNPFAPAPDKPRLPEAEVRRRYPILRWQILEATFIGYALFYLVRNNLSVVAKDIEGALHYDHSQIGNILAMTALSYGLGKFVMGALSDRSNARTFMAAGLLFTALCNFAFGSIGTYNAHFWLWALNGFVQGMGWPPCGRSMSHWFGARERGFTFSIWNTSHNVGGAIAGVIAAKSAIYFGGWEYAFFVPGCIAVIGALYLLLRLRDTPQSEGLPPIEEYLRGDSATSRPLEMERNLSYRELIVDNVLLNKWVWLLAFANFFAYIARYSMLDWGPLFVREVKGADISGGGWVVFFSEIGGIPSTIALGWLTDRIGGRRGTVATLCMLPILAAFAAIMVIPEGLLWLDMVMMFLIGVFIYPVINLIVIIALDLTSKKAIGTVAGFIGLFGYLGRMAQAKGFGELLHYLEAAYGKESAWQVVLAAIMAATVLGMLLLALTWRLRPSKA